MLDNPRRRWPFSLKGELEMADDAIDNFVIFDKGDDFYHLRRIEGRGKDQF